MNTLGYIYWGYFYNQCYVFGDQHPIITIILLFFITRSIMRWFFGISALRRAQRRYTELLENHNAMLERQSNLLERHEGVMSKLGEKYL